jgi:cell division FtsZ-interacting protein ZapD
MTDDSSPPPLRTDLDPLVAEYDRLRKRLRELWSAPVRDMAAIDAVMSKLDEAHAAFKAAHGRPDQQRY